MKKLFLTLCMFVATGAFLADSANAESVAVKKVIEVPGATKEQLMQKVREWSERYAEFYSTDAKSGIVVSNGEIAYPSPPIDRAQYAFLFKSKNYVQNNKVTVTFEDVMLRTPRQYNAESGAAMSYIGGEAEPVKSKKDIAAANKILNYTAVNLEDFLHKKTVTSCPLERCEECGLLLTSPAELKKHYEKFHKEHESMPKK